VKPETKEKIRQYQLGRPKSNRGKPRPWYSGEKCHFWRGGVSKVNRTERQNFSRTLEYINLRRQVLARDKYVCVLCGDHSYKNRPGGHCYLVVDHIKPYALFPELRLEPTNLRTLCNECHKKTDTYGVKTLRVLQSMNV
jgi:5-methylcytosine-specific restriction endonuclease McrA